MGTKPKDVCLLVHGHDGSLKAWEGFYLSHSRYFHWDVPVVFVSETQFPLDMPKGWVQIFTGRCPFGESLITALSLITKYILFTCIDVWWTRDIDFLAGHYDYFQARKLNALHLIPALPTVPFIFTGKEDGQYIQYAQDSPYLMSLSVSFWDKEFLRKYLREEEDPWQTENQGTERMRQEKDLRIWGVKGINHYYINAIKKGQFDDKALEYLQILRGGV